MSAGSSLSSKLGCDVIAGFAQAAALLGCEDGSVEVSDDVERAGSPAGHDTGEQQRRHVAEGRVVMLALLDHQSVVAVGPGGIDSACPVGGHEERFRKWGVAGFGWFPVVPVHARGLEAGHQPAEGSCAGE